MRLSWALVHSKHQDDVNRGISMIEGQNLVLFALCITRTCLVN
jgi:hypothetical protein